MKTIIISFDFATSTGYAIHDYDKIIESGDIVSRKQVTYTNGKKGYVLCLDTFAENIYNLLYSYLSKKIGITVVYEKPISYAGRESVGAKLSGIFLGIAYSLNREILERPVQKILIANEVSPSEYRTCACDYAKLIANKNTFKYYKLPIKAKSWDKFQSIAYAYRLGYKPKTDNEADAIVLIDDFFKKNRSKKIR